MQCSQSKQKRARLLTFESNIATLLRRLEMGQMSDYDIRPQGKVWVGH